MHSQRVIVDADLAALYGFETKRLNEAVKRTLAKFPADFMFTFTAKEFAALGSQFATSNDLAAASPGRGGRRYAPRVFTKHGALRAATILNSPRAVEISVYGTQFGCETLQHADATGHKKRESAHTKLREVKGTAGHLRSIQRTFTIEAIAQLPNPCQRLVADMLQTVVTQR